MRKWRPVKATKEQALDFMRRKEMVSIHDFVNEFGYSYSGANKRLLSLKREQLIAKLGAVRGKWILTEMGFKKLRFYGRI